MIRPILGCFGVLAVVGPLTADVVDSVAFDEVFSASFFGDPANDLVFFDTSIAEPYTLSAITWDGLATPTEDPDLTGSGRFPTFGAELRVRITNEDSGAFADMTVGSGMTFGPDSTQFTGSSYGLTGTVVNPGDLFSFEFYEDFDDSNVHPDAVWDSITFRFHDDRPAEDVIRFDTTGLRTWVTAPGDLTSPGGAGAGYFGIEYGAGGAGPSIASVRLEGHDFFTFWFDLRTDVGIDDGGQFEVSRLLGLSPPQATFSDEDPSVDPDTGQPLFAGTFGTLELSFDEGDFGPGDLIRFGVLTQSDDFLESTSGDQMGQLQFSGPLSITVTFDDGTKVTAPLMDPDPDFSQSAAVDLNVLDRVDPTGGDSDGDGDVDGDDLLHTLLGLGTRFGASPFDGDVDGQGDVDDDDLAIVAANLGAGVALPPAGHAHSAAVPEPAGWALMLIGTFVVICCRQFPQHTRRTVGDRVDSVPGQF